MSEITVIKPTHVKTEEFYDEYYIEIPKIYGEDPKEYYNTYFFEVKWDEKWEEYIKFHQVIVKKNFPEITRDIINNFYKKIPYMNYRLNKKYWFWRDLRFNFPYFLNWFVNINTLQLNREGLDILTQFYSIEELKPVYSLPNDIYLYSSLEQYKEELQSLYKTLEQGYLISRQLFILLSHSDEIITCYFKNCLQMDEEWRRENQWGKTRLWNDIYGTIEGSLWKDKRHSPEENTEPYYDINNLKKVIKKAILFKKGEVIEIALTPIEELKDFLRKNNNRITAGRYSSLINKSYKVSLRILKGFVAERKVEVRREEKGRYVYFIQPIIR